MDFVYSNENIKQFSLDDTMSNAKYLIKCSKKVAEMIGKKLDAMDPSPLYNIVNTGFITNNKKAAIAACKAAGLAKGDYKLVRFNMIRRAKDMGITAGRAAAKAGSQILDKATR